MEQRLANIDLDNADELWSVLTDGERQEFEAILQSNDIEKMLPEWIPWWEQTVERKLVQELNEVPQYKKLCPALVTIGEFKGEMVIKMNKKSIMQQRRILQRFKSSLIFFSEAYRSQSN